MTEEKKQEKKLTDKEKAFCYNYVMNPETQWNKTQSAIAAGYSENSARCIGHQNYTKPYIKKEIDRLIDEDRETDKELAKRVIEERKKMAFSDIADIIDLEKGIIKDVSKIPTELIKKITYKNVLDETEYTDKETGQKKKKSKWVTSIDKIELHEKTKNLDGLASYLGLDKKVVDITGDGPLDIKIEFVKAEGKNE